MEKKKIDGKMKSVASIPANYVSILQLQERWMREKERKQKKGDLVEREVKQQVNGQRRREEEEDVMKVVEETMEPSVKLEEKGLGGCFIRHCGVNRWKKEPNCVEKEELEKVSATVSKKEEDGGEGDSREKKKKNVKEIVKCESKVSPAYIPREENNNNPVKEIAAKDSTAEETQFQDLSIKKRVEDEGREVKGPARLNNGQGYDRKNQRHDWSSTRVIRATTTRTMVWVKKGKNDGAGCGNGV